MSTQTKSDEAAEQLKTLVDFCHQSEDISEPELIVRVASTIETYKSIAASRIVEARKQVEESPIKHFGPLPSSGTGRLIITNTLCFAGYTAAFVGLVALRQYLQGLGEPTLADTVFVIGSVGSLFSVWIAAHFVKDRSRKAWLQERSGLMSTLERLA